MDTYSAPRVGSVKKGGVANEPANWSFNFHEHWHSWWRTSNGLVFVFSVL
jgi:hypothetical protein